MNANLLTALVLLLLASLCAQSHGQTIDGTLCQIASMDETGFPDTPVGFVIQSFDDSSAPMSTGGATFEAVVTGGSASPIIDNGDGTYSGMWTTASTGEYSLEIKLVDPVEVSISGSPFAVDVIPAPVQTSAFRSYASGNGVDFLTPSCVGSTVTFTIQAKDVNGNTVTHGGDAFTATAQNMLFQSTSVTLTDNLDGTYSGSYVPTLLGLWRVAIKLNGINIYGSPYRPVHLPC